MVNVSCDIMQTPMERMHPTLRRRRQQQQRNDGNARRQGYFPLRRREDRAVHKTLHLISNALYRTSQAFIGDAGDDTFEERDALGLQPFERPLYATDGGRRSIQHNIRELRYVTVVWCIIGSLAFWWWAGFAVHNTQILHGYPKYAINAPGTFYSNRYGFEWGLVYTLWFNYLPIVLGMAAIAQVNMISRAVIQFSIGAMVFIANAVVFVILSGMWLFAINMGITVDSMGSDPKACGVYFASSRGVKVCPNVVGCPDLDRSDLCRSSPFFEHWLMSLLFNVWLFFMLYQNIQLRGYGNWTLMQSDGDMSYNPDDDDAVDDDAAGGTFAKGDSAFNDVDETMSDHNDWSPAVP